MEKKILDGIIDGLLDVIVDEMTDELEKVNDLVIKELEDLVHDEVINTNDALTLLSFAGYEFKDVTKIPSDELRYLVVAHDPAGFPTVTIFGWGEDKIVNLYIWVDDKDAPLSDEILGDAGAVMMDHLSKLCPTLGQFLGKMNFSVRLWRLEMVVTGEDDKQQTRLLKGESFDMLIPQELEEEEDDDPA